MTSNLRNIIGVPYFNFFFYKKYIIEIQMIMFNT